MGTLSAVLLAFAAGIRPAPAREAVVSLCTAAPPHAAASLHTAAPLHTVAVQPVAARAVAVAGPQKRRDDQRPVGLRPLDFEAATRAARLEQKPLLLLFCDGEAACARGAREMLGEAKLRQWLDDRLVAIQVDAARSAELVDRYRVRRLPVYLFVDAQGVELDRLVGARTSAALRAEGDVILAGGDALARLEKRLAGRAEDLELRLRRADILCDRGDLAAALAEYLAIHALGGPLGAEAFGEVLRLARIYPAAADAVGAIAAELEPGILALESSDDEFTRWLGLCTALRLETRMLGVFDALAQAEGELAQRASAFRTRLAPALRDLFYTDRRYADLAALVGDARAALAERRMRYAEVAARGDADATRTSLRRLRVDTARDYEVLVGVRRLSEALLLAEELIAFDTSIATYDALVDAALRAENRAEARLVALRGRSDARLDARTRQGIGPTIPGEGR